MDTSKLYDLLKAYREAPSEFKVTSYWRSYEKKIIKTIHSLDLNQLRSGSYPILATFGFRDVVYFYHPHLSFIKKIILIIIHRIIKDGAYSPYSLRLSDIREMAYHHCKLMGSLNRAKSIETIEASDFGNPFDLFEIDGRKYTMSFLNYYLRYCFVNKHISFSGKEIIVELGSGSGYQVEILKKLYPDLTILCFDLPAQIFLCENYLRGVLNNDCIIGTETTLNWDSLSRIKSGNIYFFGNWQFPLLKDFNFDVFWNAASFGEMEPETVKNYISYVIDNTNYIYLLQARHGKEISGKTHVNIPIDFNDYSHFFSDFTLLEEADAYEASKRISDSGGYFQAIWRKI